MGRLSVAWLLLTYPRFRRHDWLSLSGLHDYGQEGAGPARVDAGIAALVLAVNSAGLQTTQSCEGNPEWYSRLPGWSRNRCAAYLEFAAADDGFAFASATSRLAGMEGSPVELRLLRVYADESPRARVFFDPRRINKFAEHWQSVPVRSNGA